MDEPLNITRINTRLCSERKFLSASRIVISPVSKAFNCFDGPQNDEVESITIIILDSLDAVRRFAGEDHEQAVMPENARAVLSRFDHRYQHYEIQTERRDNE